MTNEQHHYAGDGLALAIAGDGALTDHWSEDGLPQVTDVDRHTMVTSDHDIAHVGERCDHTRAADNLLLTIVNYIASAGAQVVGLEGVEDILQRESVGHQRLGPEFDLVGLELASVTVDLDDPRDLLKARRYLPV